MNTERQHELLRRFFALREARTTMLSAHLRRRPAADYNSQERLDREMRALFRGRPLVAALSGDIPDTGDVMATEVAGVPLMLVRGEDAAPRAFLNICRHRGGRVMSGRGRPGRAIKCPYHSWAYDLHGDLLGQPIAREAFAEIDRAELGLIAVPVAERAGLILVRPGSQDPIDAVAELGDIGAEIAEWGFEGYRFFSERSGVFDANWKLIHDTFLESYHVFSLHKATLAPDMLSTPFVGEAFGDHQRGVVMRKEVVRLLERDESEWDLKANASVVYTLFPSVVLNLPMSGHAEFWQVYPEGGNPHRTRVDVRFYVPREPADEQERAFWEANVRFTSKVVFEEDFGQQQDIHRSLCCGLMPEVVYGRNEPVLIHYHDRVQAALDRMKPSATPLRALSP